jgi:hypothetical protein
VYRFSLASVPRQLVLASRSAVPAEMTSGSADRRPLGVRVKKIALRSASLAVEIGFNDACLADGFHKAEPRHRWTDGNAQIPPNLLACLSGPLTVEVQLGGLGLQYAVRSEAGRVIPLAERRRQDAKVA